jgi:DNA mismatch repair protein MutS
MLEQLEHFSILWRNELKSRETICKNPLKENSYSDLGIDNFVSILSSKDNNKNFIEKIFTYICEDINTINYRLDILDDFLSCDEIEKVFYKIVDKISELESYSKAETLTMADVFKLTNGLREMDVYNKCIKEIRTLLLSIEEKLHSEGLSNLFNLFSKLYLNNVNSNCYEGNSELSKELNLPASITLGINLDNALCPEEAVILSVNYNRFIKSKLINRLFLDNNEPNQSTFPFHSSTQGALKSKVVEKINTESNGLINFESTPLQLMLLSDLEKVLKDTITPIRSLINKHTNTCSKFLINLKNEIMYYLSAVNLIKKIKSTGMPMCRPEFIYSEKKACTIEGVYNINLALTKLNEVPIEDISSVIVKNNLEFNDSDNIFILTGPNSGGKTTFVQTIGLVQILSQIGLYVPADSAVLTTVDNVYTHFASTEKLDYNYGRLGEESKRLFQIFTEATERSLIILNESLASTSPRECLYMSKDIVRGLKLLGAKALFATHLHELAECIDEINNSCIGSGRLCSLVAGCEKQGEKDTNSPFKRTYTITKAPPLGISYAKDIANSFGISYEQIYKTLSSRTSYKEDIS